MFTNTDVDSNLFTRMNPVDNIKDYIKDCDYLVQLSDSESFCYSVVESLELGVPVIVTPIPVYDELGIEEDKHRITLDFDMSNVDVLKIYNSRFNFKYVHDNELIRTQWTRLLGEHKPFVKYIYKGEKNMKIKMLKNGITLVKEGITPKQGDIVEVTEDRAKVICAAHYAVIVEEAKEEPKEEEVKEAVKTVEVEEAKPEKEVEVAKVKRVTRRKK
ncbi:MAG: glycosyltransferase [Clostridia bacterium]|nr:glycosyltransferase [Clostridia bacterium]